MATTPPFTPLHTPLMVPAVESAPRRHTQSHPIIEVPQAMSRPDERCKVKGDTLTRIWLTFRLRAHDRKVVDYLPRELVDRLYAGDLLASGWYPIEHYLALYGALRKVCGHDEVVATATDSVTRALKRGSWKVFVPVLAEFAPETFCAMGTKRFTLIWKNTFQPGDATIDTFEGGARVKLTDVPFASDLAFQGGVSGGLLAIPQYAAMKATCTVQCKTKNSAEFEVRWTRAKK